MATYEFRCDTDGTIAQTMPLGQAPPAVSCPACGSAARRVFSAPQLRLGDSRARRVIDATHRSAHEPAVVSSPIGRATGPRPRRPQADPRTATLPRP